MLLLVLILGMDQLLGIDLTLDLLLGLLLALHMAYMDHEGLGHARIRLSITTLRIWISTEASSWIPFPAEPVATLEVFPVFVFIAVNNPAAATVSLTY